MVNEKEINEYRVKINKADGSEVGTAVTGDSKQIGEVYRHTRKHLGKDESAELQKRVVNPWETIEKSNE